MLKLFGAGLTIFSCFAAGCLICAEMKKRIHILEELRRMTVMLSAEIGYANTILDAVVSITDGSVDVVIGQSEITDAQRAQIEDIVKRKTEISGENIVITTMQSE